MGSTVLDNFSKLLKDNANERLDGGLKLLQHLTRENQENGESKELNHALNRLVRGLGSSKINSRKGFYTTLAVYLKLNPTTKVDTIFNIVEKELKPTGSNSKGESADINNGRILACGAIIRSGILKTCSIDEQKKVLECLMHSGKQKSYLGFESISFIVEFLNQFEDEATFAPVWPILEKDICKPFSEQTLDTFYGLLVVQDKFPNTIGKKTLKKCFGSENIINQESIAEITKVLTDLPRTVCHKHPVYKIFCKKLFETEYFEQFWTEFDKCFIKPSKTDQFLGPELFNLSLETLTNKAFVPTLLSANFLKYMLRRFTSNPKHKSDEVSAIFRKALTKLVQVIDKQVKTKVQISVLKKLLLNPGDLMIEKITGTKVIQMLTANLNGDGVKKLANVYKEIAANSKLKEKANSEPETWTNNERTYAMQLLSVKLLNHPEIVADQEWRVEQLKFLFNLGLCEASNVGVELYPHFKESFYRALDHKLPKLDDLRTVLSSLISYVDETVFQSSGVKLRTPLDEAATESWTKMMKLVKKLEKSEAKSDDGNVSAVFHTMDVHMGLQLFSDPEMAISSIDELHSCYDRLKTTKKKKKKAATSKKNNSSVVEEEEEPEWVEVVVDLLLSLLSRKNHLLRSLVGCVFPHICPHLTANAVHQILAVLDVKSGKNPLSNSKDDKESDSEAESDEEDGEEEEEEENSDEEAKQQIEEESDSDVEESDVEDETVTDRLRLAVSQALGDVTMQTDDEDVDVDNINEEEGKRLDESLAAAFRILKENRKSQTKKQEKSAEALTHFRVRVLDLLEMYLETSPSMALAMDMLVPLFMLLEFTIKDPHQKPLENRVRSCLKKLAGLKKFKNVEDVDGELLTTILKALIEKGERSASICQEMGDKLAECCVFLVRCSQQTEGCTESFVQILGENLTAFFKKRDCILPQVLFRNLFQLCWVGNWYLAPLVVNFAFDESVRSYRRGQALEFLKILYGNTRLITSEEHKDVRLKMERSLCKSSISVLSELSSAHGNKNGTTTAAAGSDVGKELKQKFVCNLFALLFSVHAHHIPEAWNWTEISEGMASYRSVVSLAKDAKSAYNRLANRIGAPVVVKKKQNNVDSKPRLGNDNDNSDSEEEETANGEEKISNGKTESSEGLPKQKEKKRKKKQSNDKHKLKKEARELREKAMSEGLESFDFSSVNIPNGVDEEPDESPVQNGDSSEVKTPHKKQKRPSLNASGVSPSKKKKKAVQSGD